MWIVCECEYCYISTKHMLHCPEFSILILHNFFDLFTCIFPVYFHFSPTCMDCKQLQKNVYMRTIWIYHRLNEMLLTIVMRHLQHISRFVVHVNFFFLLPSSPLGHLMSISLSLLFFISLHAFDLFVLQLIRVWENQHLCVHLFALRFVHE